MPAPMRIAFYAPLKPPGHPVPSGDRAVARLLMRALEMAGHEVTLAAALRSHTPQPEPGLLRTLEIEAAAIRAGLLDHYRRESPPQLWFTYHPYYKAPDLIGPPVAAALGIPYVTAEASHAGKRDRDGWRDWQRPVTAALRQGALHFCQTARDREGLAALLGSEERLVDLPPFLDDAPYLHAPAGAARGEGPVRLVTVAMMRPDNKLDSYRFLAAALDHLQAAPWRLHVIGDGPARPQVEAAFARFDSGRIAWSRDLPAEAIRGHLAGSDLFVWPGVREAYGVSYLEASASALPVLATHDGGVPAVVEHGRTGLLTPAGDVAAYAAALAGLMAAPAERLRLGRGGRAFIREERSLPVAAGRIGAALERLAAQAR